MEEKQNGTEVYGVDGIYFKTMEEAQKFNEQFNGGKKEVQSIKLFDDCDEYARVDADDAIERLCEKKFDIMDYVKLPFAVNYNYVSGASGGSKSCSMRTLQMLVTLADKRLKEKHTYPIEVEDNEMVKIEASNWTVEMTARQFITLYEIYKNACDKLNETNEKLKTIMSRGNYDKAKYSQICKKLLLKEGEEPIYCRLEMLEKDRYQDKNYLDLE